jgi:hypothetical protein
MHANEEQAREIVLEKARELAGEFPAERIFVLCCANVWQPTMREEAASWAVQIGNGTEQQAARTFAAAAEKARAALSPAGKLSKAAALRAQAEQLEREAAAK